MYIDQRFKSHLVLAISTLSYELTTACVKNCGLHNHKYWYNNFICMFSKLAWHFTRRNSKKYWGSIFKKLLVVMLLGLLIQVYVHVHLQLPQFLSHCVWNEPKHRTVLYWGGWWHVNITSLVHLSHFCTMSTFCKFCKLISMKNNSLLNCSVVKCLIAKSNFFFA
jgi:hypothetical protein